MSEKMMKNKKRAMVMEFVCAAVCAAASVICLACGDIWFGVALACFSVADLSTGMIAYNKSKTYNAAN